MNRLAKEKSPYLLQHAENPVDWYPWGEEAFTRAQREDKPLLVSIGYSTCHWCHVMERESFENADIARIMNERFVCVKLDREERPDVDKIYMTAVQAMTGQGGWPLNVFLTPEGEPFFGGTYFPPEPRYGQPSWPALLKRVSELWAERKQELKGDALRMAQSIREMSEAGPGEPKLDPAPFKRPYQGEHAPRFPMPVYLSYLLRAGETAFVVQALKTMGAGGIFDHVGGGFHRYSVDARWHVPHFEKMLYDNAQLATVAFEAHMLSGDAKIAEIGTRTLEYLMRDLRHPEGGFYSAEDADSEGREGAFYVWPYRAELARYGVKDGGNVEHDPHGEFEGLNVLYDTRPDEPAADFTALLAERAKRPRPHLDDKILASWNGLALTAFSTAYRALGRLEHLEAATRCAEFLKDKLWADGRLWRRWRDGQRAVPGTADDYAFVAQGALDLFEAGGEPRWLEWAVELTRVQQELFSAPEGGLYMTAEGHDPRLIARVVEDADNVEPSASSVAAGTLLRLFRLTGDASWRKAADAILARFGGVMESRPQALPHMLGVVAVDRRPPEELVVVGKELLAQARRRFAPHRALIAHDSKLTRLIPWLKDIPSEGSRAYLCRGRACGAPLKTVEALREALG